LSILFHGDVAKIRSFEAEQAQAHKTTIFSGVSMTKYPFSPAGGAILGQQFCTLTQKVLDFQGLFVFFWMKTNILQHCTFS
jgi:hypothetical protein